MEGFLLLSVLSLAMFLGCWVAGMVPLSMALPESKVRLITVFGAGLLVGTALAVIIPEGVSAVYEAQKEPLIAGTTSAADTILEGAEAVKEVGRLPEPQDGDHHDDSPKLPSLKVNDKDKPSVNAVDPVPVRAKREEGHGHSHGHTHSSKVALNLDVHSAIGLALVIGFVFMLIVDQISSIGARRDTELGVVQPRYKITATIGLVVHAAADGIALGAASTTKHTEIQFIVFVAIMLHKAPAAFGLVTFLQYEGLDKPRIRKHLLFFALAAPLAALFTYLGIRQGGGEALSSLSSTGLLMLFSAGTFLYVATVHVLPEIVNAGGGPGGEGGGGLGHSHGGGGAFALNELVAIVAGALTPALLTLGHSH